MYVDKMIYYTQHILSGNALKKYKCLGSMQGVGKGYSWISVESVINDECYHGKMMDLVKDWC